VSIKKEIEELNNQYYNYFLFKEQAESISDFIDKSNSNELQIKEAYKDLEESNNASKLSLETLKQTIINYNKINQKILEEWCDLHISTCKKMKETPLIEKSKRNIINKNIELWNKFRFSLDFNILIYEINNNDYDYQKNYKIILEKTLNSLY